MRLQLPKLTHKGRAVLGVCLVVPIAATVFLACSMAYTRKKAGGLLRDIQTLKVGESKIVDAHLLLKRYGGRFEKLTSPGYPGADDLDLFFSVQYKLLEEWLVARWKVRRFLSTQALPQSGGCCDLDFWRGLVAFIRIKGGRVTGSRVVIQVRRKDGFALLGNVEVVRVMPDS